MKFKDWYREKHKYLNIDQFGWGIRDEPLIEMHNRYMDSMAEYVDEQLEKMRNV